MCVFCSSPVQLFTLLMQSSNWFTVYFSNSFTRKPSLVRKESHEVMVPSTSRLKKGLVNMQSYHSLMWVFCYVRITCKIRGMALILFIYLFIYVGQLLLLWSFKLSLIFIWSNFYFNPHTDFSGFVEVLCDPNSSVGQIGQ